MISVKSLLAYSFFRSFAYYFVWRYIWIWRQSGSCNETKFVFLILIYKVFYLTSTFFPEEDRSQKPIWQTKKKSVKWQHKIFLNFPIILYYLENCSANIYQFCFHYYKLSIIIIKDYFKVLQSKHRIFFVSISVQNSSFFY